MYIFKRENGDLTPAYRDFDPAKPDFARLADVAEIYAVGKVYTKQIKLVAKSPAEIASIKAAAAIDVGVDTHGAPEPKKRAVKRGA